MNRRSFLVAILYGLVVLLVSRLRPSTYGAVFRVKSVCKFVYGVDPRNHVGAYVFHATRCCKNCPNIFGVWSPGDKTKPSCFSHEELTAVNAPAAEILKAVEESRRLRRARYALAV